MNEVDLRSGGAGGDVHEAVGSYVVHALEEPELSEFEAHVAGCEQCAAEIAEFDETLAELSAAFAVAPPAPLRASVLSAIAGVSQLPAEDEIPADVAERTPRHAAPSDELEVQPEVQPEPVEDRPVAPVVSLADVRRRRASRALIAVAAAVALIAVAAGGWAVNLNQRLQQQQAGQALTQQQAQREASLLRAPDAKIYSATLKNGDPVSYVVSKSQNAAVLIGGNVPSPGAGKVYQLWTVQGFGSPSASFYRDATFDAGTQAGVFLTTDVAKANALGISIEPAGTTPTKPTTDPFALAKI